MAASHARLVHTWLTIHACREVLFIALVSRLGSRILCRVLTRPRRGGRSPADAALVTAVVDALNRPWFLRLTPPRGLQRPAVVTRLLRRYGIAADLVIGWHPPPVRGHAWVEVAGAVVYAPRPNLAAYRVLARW